MNDNPTMADELAVSFQCEQDELIGILHVGSPSNTVGVLFIVGGRQYRAGAHRQFTLLARDLCKFGFSSFRFDVRGMGDSGGEPRHFLELEQDISSALTAFKKKAPQIKQVLLWGLCDGASAAIVNASSLPYVKGVVMVNPWITSDVSAAKVQLKYYYRDRIVNKEFWRKIIRGEMNFPDSLNSLFKVIYKSLRKSPEESKPLLSNVVFGAIRDYRGKIFILISEKDITAREFENEYVKEFGIHGEERESISLKRVHADHTFTALNQQEMLSALTIEYVQSLS